MSACRCSSGCPSHGPTRSRATLIPPTLAMPRAICSWHNSTPLSGTQQGQQNREPLPRSLVVFVCPCLRVSAFFFLLAHNAQAHKHTRTHAHTHTRTHAHKHTVCTHQCQLLTLATSGRSSTIHLGSPSPHLAIVNLVCVVCTKQTNKQTNK